MIFPYFVIVFFPSKIHNFFMLIRKITLSNFSAGHYYFLTSEGGIADYGLNI